MKERPILFSAPMVKAILEGRKTQTRRIVKPQPVFREPMSSAAVDEAWQAGFVDVKCPYGKHGDWLWVRENLSIVADGIEYAADGELGFDLSEGQPQQVFDLWNKRAHEDGPDIHPATVSSMFMPRWASRITLEVSGIRVEQVQEISNTDAVAEGVYGIAHEHPELKPAELYRLLWNKINGKDSWESNPWVWVVEFAKIEAGKNGRML